MLTVSQQPLATPSSDSFKSYGLGDTFMNGKGNVYAVGDTSLIRVGYEERDSSSPNHGKVMPSTHLRVIPFNKAAKQKHMKSGCVPFYGVICIASGKLPEKGVDPGCSKGMDPFTGTTEAGCATPQPSGLGTPLSEVGNTVSNTPTNPKY